MVPPRSVSTGVSPPPPILYACVCAALPFGKRGHYLFMRWFYPVCTCSSMSVAPCSLWGREAWFTNTGPARPAGLLKREATQHRLPRVSFTIHRPLERPRAWASCGRCLLMGYSEYTGSARNSACTCFILLLFARVAFPIHRRICS